MLGSGILHVFLVKFFEFLCLRESREFVHHVKQLHCGEKGKELLGNLDSVIGEECITILCGRNPAQFVHLPASYDVIMRQYCESREVQPDQRENHQPISRRTDGNEIMFD